MKIGPVNKLYKRNKATSRTINVDVMLKKVYVSLFFNLRPIWSNLKADSGRVVFNTFIFINSNFLSYKNWQQN